MSEEPETSNSSLERLLVDVFENGILNIEMESFIKGRLNHVNSKFISENILTDQFEENNSLVTLPSALPRQCSLKDMININKIVLYLTEKNYETLYSLIDDLTATSAFIGSNVTIKYLQIYCLYAIWEDKTTLLSILEDGLGLDTIYAEEGIDDLKIENKMTMQDLKEVKMLSVPVAVSLPFLLTQINETISGSYDSNDNFGLSCLYWLRGVLLNKQNKKKNAIESLTLSLKKNPYNWEAYKEMSRCIERAEEVSILLDYISKEVSYTLLFEFFQVECWAFFFQTSNRDVYIDKLTNLLSIFPRSKYLLIKNATLASELKDLVQSEIFFETLLKTHAYSLEATDLYSNVLYVTGNIPKLKTLLNRAKIINEISTECQTIAGNYESVMKNHEKAVVHFKRAIKLSTSDSEQKSKLYTLIGHEFIEMTNHHVAIASYRKATLLDARNYSAWMGLALGYDILKQYQFSVYYYQKAVSIKADDSRAWFSMGECYEKLGKWSQAINCFTRSYENSVNRNKKVISAEKIIALQLYLNNTDGLREWHKEIAKIPHEDNAYINACKWLCQDAVENLHDHEEARRYWQILKQIGIIMEDYLFLDTSASKD